MYNIVIVDDEREILDGLEKIIKMIDKNYEVIGKFETSESAYKYIKNNKTQLDLLITDISMSGENGLQLIERLRNKGFSVPCIVLTGYSDFEYAKKSISLGVVNYLLKPVDVQELKETMEHLFLKKIYTDRVHICASLSKEVLFIKKEIETNFKTFNMNEIAEKIGLSKEYLYRIYKKETGMAVKDYLLEVRMNNACKYLSECGTYKIYEVCEMIGYDDQIHFSKIFKKKFGITPKDFQKHSGSN